MKRFSAHCPPAWLGGSGCGNRIYLARSNRLRLLHPCGGEARVRSRPSCASRSSGRSDRASCRSPVRGRRLCPAHNSAITGSHDDAVDPTIATVALRKRARRPFRRSGGANAIVRQAPGRRDRCDSDVAKAQAHSDHRPRAKGVVSAVGRRRVLHGLRSSPATASETAARSLMEPRDHRGGGLPPLVRSGRVAHRPPYSRLLPSPKAIALDPTSRWC